MPNQSRGDDLSLAAIAVFAYRRPEELSTCLRALEKNLLADRSDVTIFVDGARSAEEKSEVLATYQVASADWRFGSTMSGNPTRIGAFVAP